MEARRLLIIMKFFKPFTLEGFLFGLGIAVVTSAVAPIIKENTRNIAVKGTEGMLAAGNKMNDVKDNMMDRVSNMGGSESGDQSQEMLYQEIRKEREQLQELLAELNNIKSDMNQAENMDINE